MKQEIENLWSTFDFERLRRGHPLMLNVTRKRGKNFVEKLSGDRTGSISSEHLTHTEIKDKKN